MVFWNGVSKSGRFRDIGLISIFDMRTLWRSAVSVRVPGCQKLQMTA